MNNLKNKPKKTWRNNSNSKKILKKHSYKTRVKSDSSPSEFSNDECEKLKQALDLERMEKEKYKVSLKKFLYEKQELLDILKKCQSERDTYKLDLDTLKQIHIKELRRSKAEIDSLTKEYCQVMSERDNVHKEIEALHEKLNKSQDKVKELNRTSSFNNTENNNNTILNTTILDDLQIDTLKRQLKIVLKQRDDLLAQNEEFKKKLGITFNQKELDPNSFDDDLSLKKEINCLIKELDLCKKRRDIAFIERDKILRERESIRALCDELRHQRDKSFSELAESLRENDELKKEKSLAVKQIQLLENKLEYYEDKLISYREQEIRDNEKKTKNGHREVSKSIEVLSKSASRMLILNNNQDEENNRILKVEINLDENPELGVEFSFATYEFDNDEELNEFKKRNKSNNLIIINSVDPESISYGKLKENDIVLKINEYDLKNVDVDELEEIIKNLNGNVEFIVSRHFSKALHSELESSSDLVEEDVDFSTLPSMSSLTSSFISNKDRQLIRSKKSRSSDKTDTNSIDYVSYLTNKQNKKILIELDNLKDIKLETGIFISGFNGDTASDYEFKNVSIGDRVISLNGEFMKNKAIFDLDKILNETKQNQKIKILIEKVSNLGNMSISSPSSSMLSLNLDLNNLKFKSKQKDDISLLSSNSLTSSVILNESCTKKENFKPDSIRPLYYDNNKKERPESRLFDKIVNGSLRYEDLISNLHKEISSGNLSDARNETEIINKIYL
ncbi:unnamed protein product [Brachionus calyciflorus]|uniref:PDZ domain-containing protein n=1 Tax=Brachionus calyciflorus TaxID=104777 RepID=A0A813WNW3_9BILA|nr:unnamed protein product [Brachionus calyciflorus]